MIYQSYHKKRSMVAYMRITVIEDFVQFCRALRLKRIQTKIRDCWIGIESKISFRLVKSSLASHLWFSQGWLAYVQSQEVRHPTSEGSYWERHFPGGYRLIELIQITHVSRTILMDPRPTSPGIVGRRACNETTDTLCSKYRENGLSARGLPNPRRTKLIRLVECKAQHV